MDGLNIEVLLKVIETKSFRKAAQELGYTQAGISYIINSIEKEIGLPLFVREHNGVHLSNEGQVLLPMLKQYAVWKYQFKQRVNELKGLENGTIRVQIFDSISIHWIPSIVQQFNNDYPGIKIELITEEDSLRAEEMVKSGEVDCGFFLTKVNSEIDVYPLLEESLKVILPLDHPLANNKTFPISQIGDYPYIGMKYDEHTGIQDIFVKQGVLPKRVYSLDNDYAAMAMISKGLGYGIFPELLLRFIPYEVKCLEFDIPQKRCVSIGTRSIHTCSQATKKFIEYTRIWVKRNTKMKQ
ncbi:MAG: LysR family transcriptional regulator [Bacillota bacterium]|nr:LysR family transcriptional regulator [Bacillota bacterium]